MSDRVTLQTIADHLGVSRTTISNAYNRPDQLTVGLRSQIMAAADELGYRGPSAAGRMLRTGRIGTIGLVFTADLKYVFSDPDTALFMRGVAQASASARTGLTLLPAPPGVAIEATALGTAPVDGYIVYSVSDAHPAIGAVLERNVPVVIVDEPDLGTRTSFVGIDDRAGAHIAARHVVGLGHTAVGVIVDRLSDEPERRPVPSRSWPASTIRIARARLDGYREALSAGGIDTADVPVWEAGETTRTPGAARRSNSCTLIPSSRLCCAPPIRSPSVQHRRGSRSVAACRRTSRWWVSTTFRGLRRSLLHSPRSGSHSSTKGVSPPSC